MSPGPRDSIPGVVCKMQKLIHSSIHLVFFHFHLEVFRDLSHLTLRNIVIKHKAYSCVFGAVGCSVPVTIRCSWRQGVVRSLSIYILGACVNLLVSKIHGLAGAVFPVGVAWNVVFASFLVEGYADG